MIRGFWQSKLTAAGIFAASAVLAVLVWARRWGDGGPIYIPIVASLLLLALGCVLGRLAGNIVAGNVNVKLLGYLHVDLDPGRFVDAYGSVPGKLKPGSVDHAVARAYLADGYAAGGEFQRALDTLTLPVEKNKRYAALRGNVLQKRCSYQLFAGDAQAAKGTLKELDELIESTEGSANANPQLLTNLKNSRRILQNRLNVLGNKQVEESFLLAQVQKASYQLLRLELWQALAQLAAREGDGDKRVYYLQKLTDEGGKTFFPRWAAEQTPQP